MHINKNRWVEVVKMGWQWRPWPSFVHQHWECFSNTDKLASIPFTAFTWSIPTAKVPKISFCIHSTGEEWLHGKTDTTVGNFPNLWFNEDLIVKSDTDIKAVIKPAYANPNRSFSFNISHTFCVLSFDLILFIIIFNTGIFKTLYCRQRQ